MHAQVEYESNEPESYNVIPIDYEDTEGGDVVRLRGYLSLPKKLEGPTPLIVVFPGWDGVSDYEKKRATLLSELGYIAFAADIYGANLQDITDQDVMSSQMGEYMSDPALCLKRMQRAIDVASDTEYAVVDKENIGIIGYCFGGSGVV